MKPYLRIKSIADRFLAFVFILCFFPFYLLLFIKPSLLFRQERIGYRGEIFLMLKLKTMSDSRDAAGQLLPDAERMTPTGRILRKYSLDEFPQVLNILRGEMSWIGPRPLMKEYKGLLNEAAQKRHEVKPGITGWAQINGRNAIHWLQKFELDLYYTQHISLLLDLKILFGTFLHLILFRDGDIPMPKLQKEDIEDLKA